MISSDIFSYIKCDVLVIGSGVAGCNSAISAARNGANTVMVTKGKAFKSGSTFFPLNYGFGIQAHTLEAEKGDSIEQHYQDIVIASRGLCDKETAKTLAEQAPACIQDLKNMGIDFDKGKDNKSLQVLGCYSSKKRCFQMTGLKQYVNCFSRELKNNKAQIIEETSIITLLYDDKNEECFGAVGIDNEGNMLLIDAKATILATGGGNNLFKHSLTTKEMNGDGYALALKAGAMIRNLEFIQFGWGLLYPSYKFPFLDRLLRYHPQITNGTGEPIYNKICSANDWYKLMEQRAIHFPFTCEDDSKIIDKTILDVSLSEKAGKNGGVYINCKGIPIDKISKAPLWPIWYNWLKSKNLDPLNQEFEITIFAHAFNGGVWIDKNAKTSINRLYAVGEVASGPHGADRLGGNIQLASVVFGKIAGKNAANLSKNSLNVGNDKLIQILKHIVDSNIKKDYKKGKENINIQDIKNKLWENVSVYRTEKGLMSTLDLILSLKNKCNNWANMFVKGDLIKTKQIAELNTFLLAAHSVVLSALKREESRGTHYRLDYPKHDDKLYYITLKKGNKNDEINAEKEFL